MNECKITKRSTWFQQARYAVNNKSRAQTAIEELVIDRFGSESGFQDILSARANDDDYWSALWDELGEYWRIKAGIEGGGEENLLVSATVGLSFRPHALFLRLRPSCRNMRGSGRP